MNLRRTERAYAPPGVVAYTKKWLYVCPKCGADYESDLELTTECGTCHVMIFGCIALAQVEDDYYIAHDHGGPTTVRLALMFAAWLCGAAAVAVAVYRRPA
jgi:hypothetical protein